MPQISSWTIANSGGSTYRAAVNSALSAIQSSSSGTAAPSPTVAGMLWYDTTNSILKRRNTANTAWIDVNSDTVAATTVQGNSSGSAAAETALSMPTLRTMLGFPTVSAGLGQFQLLYAGAGAALTLPSGGTWAFLSIALLSAGALSAGSSASVLAGGTVIGPATAGRDYIGFAWRVS